MDFIIKPDECIILPSDENSKGSYFPTFQDYQRLYEKSIQNPNKFWSDMAQQLFWKNPPKNVFTSNIDVRKGPISIKFMEGALTNVCYNVLDRVIDRGLGDVIAYHWEGNDGKTKRRITYTELRREVCKFANALKGLGVKKGDRIAIYMPVSIEGVVAMLACARIGAVHSVVFSGYSPESLAVRIIDARCMLLISSDGCYRGNKLIPLKDLVDSALNICTQRGYQKITNIVNKHLKYDSTGKVSTNGYSYAWNDQVDICWEKLIIGSNPECEPVWVDSEDTLFILYTSGSTGSPKGIVLNSGSSLLMGYLAFKYIWDLKEREVFFTTSDFGWCVSHFYSVYGGLANGATMVLMEGVPTFPNPYRLWEIIDRLQVKVFWTAPTAIRSLMKLGDHYVKAYKRDSLRVLGVTGEPINPEAWLWYWKVVGDGRCSVVDTYGQSEYCPHTILNLPGCIPMKPGSSALPFFGVVPALLDYNGNEIIGPGKGYLVYKKAWPGITRTIDGKHDLYETTYFKKFPGYYFTGDESRRDSDGYYFIMGRIDDTLNVCGRLLSTAEIEGAIGEHRAVSEAASVSAPHSLKGEVPLVFVVLNNGYIMTTDLESDLKNRAREKIGGHAVPDVVISVSSLPKTRTGKVMRRILHKIVRNDYNFGDTSTMEDESVLIELKSIKF